VAGLLSWLATAQAGEGIMTQGGDALARRIDEIESRLACTDLVHAYARFIRSDQPEMASTLFVPEGTFEVRDGHPDRPEFTVRSHNASRAEIHAHLAPNKGKPHPVPLIHNLSIEVDGDTARGNCVMEAQIYGSQVKVKGEYHDSFRREGGKWYFTARTYTIFSGDSSI
jgi:SnoaL-like domain